MGWQVGTGTPQHFYHKCSSLVCGKHLGWHHWYLVGLWGIPQRWRNQAAAHKNVVIPHNYHLNSSSKHLPATLSTFSFTSCGTMSLGGNCCFIPLRERRFALAGRPLGTAIGWPGIVVSRRLHVDSTVSSSKGELTCKHECQLKAEWRPLESINKTIDPIAYPDQPDLFHEKAKLLSLS